MIFHHLLKKENVTTLLLSKQLYMLINFLSHKNASNVYSANFLKLATTSSTGGLLLAPPQKKAIVIARLKGLYRKHLC